MRLPCGIISQCTSTSELPWSFRQVLVRIQYTVSDHSERSGIDGMRPAQVLADMQENKWPSYTTSYWFLCKGAALACKSKAADTAAVFTAESAYL